MKNKREQRVLGGTRRVFKIGSSLAITLPSKFAQAHGIKVGDDLPFAANHIMKVIPMPEEQFSLPERELTREEPERTECPYCRQVVLKSALEFHIKNYCKTAPAVAS
jgi:antitoxin component of MazEF toxin-antitoxin module